MRKPRVTIERFLTGVPPFGALEGRDLARIAQGASEFDAPRGTLLFRKGDPCRGLFVVVIGQVKLALEAPDGSEKVVELVGPGGTFGETALFLDRPHGLVAETLTHSRLVQIARTTVLQELDRTPGLMRGVIHSLSRRLQHFLSDLEGYTLRTGVERVAGYLAGMLPENAGGEPAELLLPASKGIIASRLNLTQEHFSRVLRDLSREGLIRVSGRKVSVPDVARLRGRFRRDA